MVIKSPESTNKMILTVTNFGEVSDRLIGLNYSSIFT